MIFVNVNGTIMIVIKIHGNIMTCYLRMRRWETLFINEAMRTAFSREFTKASSGAYIII